MNEEPRVWIQQRKGKRRNSYRLRWVDPTTRKWRTKYAGTDVKLAQHEANKLTYELAEGLYRHVKRIDWGAFVAEDTATIIGDKHRAESKRTLEEFGRVARPASPKHVTYGMIEAFIGYLRGKENRPATINKKLVYLRRVLNKAARRGYLGTSPFQSDLFLPEYEKTPRIVTGNEETVILDACESLYGVILRTFVYVALNTGGRREELLRLSWERVEYDGDTPMVIFDRTKSRRDRKVPITPETADVFRRLQIQTLQEGGPFVGLRNNLGRKWGRVRVKAGLPDVRIHDLRATYVTRLIRAGVPLPTVQKLAGHADIKTTLRFYNWVSDGDLRAGVEKLRRSASG